MPTKRTIIPIVASFLAVLSSSACGTIQGFGRDVMEVGDNIEHSAR